ncbi:MAG TPA: DUF6770 family protein [Saprospiraceae bacterium]|nr:DUF6770 family protein [Saprospiraceae bacterium]
MLKVTIHVTYLLLLLVSDTHAQSATFQEILTVQMRDSGPLQEKGVVRGYYFIYGAESTKKDYASFILQITDANLNPLKKKTISVPDKLSLNRVECNGNSIGLKFVDLKEEKYTFKTYSLVGELLYSKTSPEFSNMEKAKFSSTAGGEQAPSFHPIKGAGYVNYMTVKSEEGKPTYNINFYSDTEAVDHWSYTSESDQVEFALHLTGDTSYIYALVAKRDALMSTDMEFFVTGFNAKTGDMVYQVPLESDAYRYLTFSAFVNDQGNVQVVGRYFDKGDNPFKDRELGFAMLTLDAQGKITQARHVPSGDAKLKVMQEGSDETDSKEYFFFHDFIQLADGKILGIAEMFSMKVNALGIMTGGAGGTIVMNDMCIFEFNENFDLQNVQQFDKYKSTFPIPGIPIFSPALYAYMVKEHGGFDYTFYQKKPDEAFAAVCYLDYERRKGEKNNTILGAIFITDAGYTTDKFDLPTEADFIKIMPGPFGSAVVMEYYRKEKELKVNTRNLNY